MKAIATGNVIAIDLLRTAVVLEADLRFLRLQVMNGDVVDLEQQRPVVGQTAFDQIFHNFLLPIDGDPLVHQRLEIDPLQIPVDADIDAPMQHALVLQTLAHSYIGEQIGGPMLDQPRANPVFDIFAAAIFDND